eukprot:TRINITY_DN47981_c0_g2_i1.p4 TRINITY_DN47981_c0_g2~~TRINITY_DN47981_c0_g2_i1.p4  ORF type:complete len:109 (+),score=37.00 TRINITY_DN47981_c0_g2_i1:63-389(+)
MCIRDRYQRRVHGINAEYMGIDKFIQIVTNDGRIFVGLLKGIDQALNACLSETEERIYCKDKGIEAIKIGIYLIRGDTIALIGEIDDDIEKNLDFSAIKAEPLKPIIN